MWKLRYFRYILLTEKGKKICVLKHSYSWKHAVIILSVWRNSLQTPPSDGEFRPSDTTFCEFYRSYQFEGIIRWNMYGDCAGDIGNKDITHTC